MVLAGAAALGAIVVRRTAAVVTGARAGGAFEVRIPVEVGNCSLLRLKQKRTLILM